MTQAQTNRITFPFNGSVKPREAALIYAGEGFSIIPLHWMTRNKCSCGKKDCSSPAKHPLTQHGLKDASNDPAQIKDWWKKFPKANIGVCTGSISGGLVIIDIDLNKGGNSNPLNLPATLEVTTGAGFHLWFRSDQEIRNSAGKLGQGIDVRGWGGYVVVPPSVHSSGQTYTFANSNPLADLPPEILVKLITPEPELEDDSLILSYVEREIPDLIPDGQRNNLLTSLGGKLRRQGFSIEEIEATLLTTNLKRCSPPLPDKAVRRIAQSVGRYQPAEQIEVSVDDQDLDFDPALDDQPQMTSQTDQSNQSAPDPFTNVFARDPLIGAITTSQLRTTVFGKPEMILQGLFKGDWGLVIGIGSVGKSAFLFNVCVCLASGRPFPPFVPEGQPPRRVLYLDFEGNYWRSQEQINILSKVLTDDENRLIDDNLHWDIEPEINGSPWRLNDVQSLKNLAAYIKLHKIDLVAIDTGSQASNLKDENSNAEVQNKIVVPIRRLVRYCDISVLVVHHEGRGKTQTKAHDMQYRGRGATALMDASRYQIAMVPFDPDKRGPVKIINTKNKGYGFDEIVMALDEKTRWFSSTQALPAPPAPKVEDMIVDVLEQSDDPAGMTPEEISGMLIGVSERTITSKLAVLVKAGRINKVKRGLYRSVWAPPEGDVEGEETGDEIGPDTPLED